MNVIREIQRINERELELNVSESGSWHAEYKDSAYVFVSGLHSALNEGDIIVVFSQFGEIVDCYLSRDEKTGKSRGFAFVAYEDQRSTVLAVDNFNGTTLKGRILRVDHVRDYHRPHVKRDRKKQYDIEEHEARQAMADEEYDARRKLIWDFEKYT